MNKDLLRTLLVYRAEDKVVFKSDVVLAMLLGHLDTEGQEIVKNALEIKSEVDTEQQQLSTNSKSYS